MYPTKMNIRIMLSLACLLLSSQALGAVSERSLLWGGCGITKKAFMAELAKAYEKKTGIKVNLQGGGATKGIRQANGGQIDIGGACRAKMSDAVEERNAYQVPVAWDALVVIVHPDNPVDSITFEKITESMAIFGSAQECIAKVKELHSKLGMKELICWYFTECRTIK